MKLHYNAFISYRHHPEDIRVATQIHRLLERFRVPRALRKQNKGISKLFRDKDELPLTSDLSESITEALQNSEFLIVICSVHTKESLWVQREIELFLQTHSRSRVLTVLVNGEPYDVIPEILLYEDVTDPVTGAVTRVPLEPLSCDWRMPLRKARREELPRLAAALLHCSYDELRQRQKQYRMQKLLVGGSIALAASLALAAYFLYTSITIHNANLQIQENYSQALKNQSQYLTTTAQERMTEGDRLTALTLLLEALPKEEMDRPYLADAERVLVDALGAYSDGRELMALGTFLPDETSTVQDFALTDDGGWIYILDDRGLITVWNTKTFLKEATIDPGTSASGMEGVSAQGHILLQGVHPNDGSRGLQCYDKDGSLLWHAPGVSECALFEGKESLLTIRNDLSGISYLDLLDLKTGAKKQESVVLTGCNSKAQYFRFQQDTYPEGTPILIKHGIAEAYEMNCLDLLNLETGNAMGIYMTDQLLSCACTTQNGKVILMVSDGSGQNNGTFLNMITTSPARQEILCFDQKTGRKLWENEIITYQYTGTGTILCIPQRDQILCQTGNTLQIIDLKTGKTIQHCEPKTGIVRIVDVAEDSASCMLQDGGYCIFDFDKNECSAMYYGLGSDIRHAEVFQGVYVLSKFEPKVTYYGYAEPNYAWEGTLEKMGIRTLTAVSDHLVLLGDSDYYYLYDFQSQTLLWKQDRTQFPYMHGFSSDNKQILLSDYGHQVVRIRTADGESQIYDLPRYKDDNYFIIEKSLYFLDDRFFFIGKTSEGCYLGEYLLDSGSIHYHTIFEGQEYLTDSSKVLYTTQEHAWVYTGDGAVHLVSLIKEDTQKILEGISYQPVLAICENGTIALTAENQVWVGTQTGQQIRLLSLEAEKAASVYFQGETLMVLTDLGSVLSYAPDGTKLSRMELAVVSSIFSWSVFNNTSNPTDLVWSEAPDGKLVLTVFGYANIFDCENNACCGTVQCDFYHPDTDTFITLDPPKYWGIRRYSLQELIRMAQAQLGDFQLSEEQQEAYGILKTAQPSLP